MGCLRIGAAGWQTVRAMEKFERTPCPALKSYSEHFNCVEVSSTFFHSPSPSTFAGWAALTPTDFRFSLRIPEAVSHVDLEIAERLSRLRTFLARIEPMGEKLGLLILTLPVDVAFNPSSIELLSRVKDQCEDRLVCQARHPSWLSPEADQMLKDEDIALASVIGGASAGPRPPVGSRRRQYWRVHHAPRGGHSSKMFSETKWLSRGAEEVWIICDTCNHAEHLVESQSIGIGDEPSTAPAAPGPPRSDCRTDSHRPDPLDASRLQRFHLYFLTKDHTVSHILAVEFSSCEEAFEWIGRHRFTHNIEVWSESELIAVCPWTLCPNRTSSTGVIAP